MPLQSTHRIYELPIHKGPYRNVDSISETNIQYMLNCAVDEAGSVVGMWGLKPYITIPDLITPISGLAWFKNTLLIFSDGKVYNQLGNLIGNTTLGSKQVHTVTYIDQYLFIADGGLLHYYDGNSIQVVPNSPTGCKQLLILDDYVIALTDIGINWADPIEPLVWHSISFIESDFKAVSELYGEMVLFRPNTTEVWSNDKINPFSKYISIDRGIGAVESVIKTNNTLYWLDSTKRFVALNGRLATVISTPYDKEIQTYQTISDCIGNLVEVNGRAYIMWSFPAENKTLIFDYLLNTWFERAIYDNQVEQFYEYVSNKHLFCSDLNKHLFGSRISGTVYEGDIDFFNDIETLTIFPKFLTGHLDCGSHNKKNCNRLTFRVKRGFGSGTIEPHLLVRFNYDNLGQWTDWQELSLGMQTESFIKLYLYSIGIFNTIQMEIKLDTTVPFVISNIHADIEDLRS